MAVPRTGKFKMFGTGSAFTIEGAISESNSSYDGTDRFSGSAHLIGDSISNKYDIDYSGVIQTDRVNVSESIQYRGYPITTATFNVSAKCSFTSSRTISGSIAPPSSNETYMCLDFISGFRLPGVDTRRYGWTTSNTNITSSGGFGDNSWPVSSSYGFHQLTHQDDRLRLKINVNGLSQTPPTFTSMTISSPGNTDLVLDYCDLLSSSSVGDIYTYTWNSLDPDNHFTSDNCITASFNTTTVDYFTDCYPSSPTNTFTITNGHTYINSQQACDENTSGTVYFHSDEVSSTNPISVGDIAYNNADGRSLNLYNGEDKYWGINTSSANTLNSVPDKIVQIGTNGRVNQILDCTQTPPYEPDLDPTSRDCNSTTANPSGVIINTTALFSAGEYDVHQIGGSSETTQSLLWSSYDRPNKFTFYDDSSTFANPIYTTGWVGKSTYANAAGKDQWSVPLDAATSGSQSIKWGSTTGRKVRVDYGYNNGTLNDVAVFSLVCTSSLQSLNVASGSSNSNACSEDFNDVHYHFHTTGSGDFSTLLNGMAVNGIHHIGRVFEDNTGLNPVLKENGKYFSYTSSAGTRYVYTVLDNTLTGNGDDWNMGIISYHQKCSGTEVAVVQLTAAGDDCDDSNITFSNNAYIQSNYSGFEVVSGRLKLDNDNLTLSERTNQTLYGSDDSINYDPQQLIHTISHDVDDDSSSNTYLVHTSSLKNPTGTKLLATVTAGAPAQIKFTPCVDSAGGCTEFAASTFFESGDFSGNDPTEYKCGLDTPDQIWIDLTGNEPAVGDGVYSLNDCSSYIDEADVYFTIYSSILDKTWVILMDSDGELIDSIWECTAEEVGNSGDNTYYLSTGYTNAGDHCGGSSTAISTAVTSNATTISNGENQTVYANGSRFNGGGKYYLVETTSTSTNGLGGDSYQIWKINSNGLVTDVSDYTCPLDKLTTKNTAGCVISLGANDNYVEFWEIEFNHEDESKFEIIWAEKTPADANFPANHTFHWVPETSFEGNIEFNTAGYPSTGRTMGMDAVNNGDQGRVILQMKDSNGIIRAIGEMDIYIVDEGNNGC